jgi:hypothetical protein
MVSVLGPLAVRPWYLYILNKKGKNCSVFCFAGKRKILFIYLWSDYMGKKKKKHWYLVVAGQRRGDVEVGSYLRDQAESRSLVFDLSIAHDYF